jgi:FeS assembly SUF system protein
MFSSLFGRKKESKAEAAEPTPVQAEPAVTSAAPDSGMPAEAAELAGLSDTTASTVAAGGGLNVDALLAPTASASTQPQIGEIDPVKTEAMKPAVVEAISTVFDPEIPVNIYELGLIYTINVDTDSRVGVQMTLTSPACPSAQQLPSEVRYKVKALPGVTDCNVEIVWEPPWTKEMMSETAKLSLGIF